MRQELAVGAALHIEIGDDVARSLLTDWDLPVCCTDQPGKGLGTG
jgi:hypothetical protein